MTVRHAHSADRYPDVIPLQRMIHRTMGDIDNYEWNGDFITADYHKKFLKHLKGLESQGEIWYPLF